MRENKKKRERERGREREREMTTKYSKPELKLD